MSHVWVQRVLKALRAIRVPLVRKARKPKTVFEMSRRELYRVPWRPDWKEPVFCSSLVFLPAKTDYLGLLRYNFQKLVAKLFRLEPPEGLPEHLHSSGFRCIVAIAVDENGYPICKVATFSDIIHIDGIGGYGWEWFKRYGGVPDLVPPVSWQIDCLPKSGAFRIFFFNKGKIRVGPPLSSLEIFAEKGGEKEGVEREETQPLGTGDEEIGVGENQALGLAWESEEVQDQGEVERAEAGNDCGTGAQDEACAAGGDQPGAFGSDAPTGEPD